MSDDATVEMDRPIHAIYDCVTGVQTLVPYTDDEWEEHKGRLAQAAEEKKAIQKQSEQAEEDMKIILAESATNPAFAALVRNRGIVI